MFRIKQILVIIFFFFSIVEIRADAGFLLFDVQLDETITIMPCGSSSHVIITWSTIYEVNNESFIIERSMNGYDFVTAGTVAGAGNSNNTTKYYSFVDTNPFLSINYYRVKAKITFGWISDMTSQKTVFVASLYPSSSTDDWKYQGKNIYVEIASTPNNPDSYIWKEYDNNLQGIHINVLPFEIKKFFCNKTMLSLILRPETQMMAE